MFQFPGSASRSRGIPCLQHGGLPHSDTCGSRPVCGSPRLFAAYHVLHRLREPRHPPYALLHFLLDSPMCSLLGILSYTSPLFFYYLLSTLSLQYVNEPFARICSFASIRNGYPSSCSGTGNAITGPRSAVDCHTANASHAHYLFQPFNSNQPRSVGLSFVSGLATRVPLCGEYRIRTDDPLLAKQVL